MQSISANARMPSQAAFAATPASGSGWCSRIAT